MDGKNRAASSYLSPGNPPADKEQNDPLAQVFRKRQRSTVLTLIYW